jgi:C-terminal processing protease CtpA/Prc
VSLRLHLAFNTRPRRLSTPRSDAFRLHPDVALNDGTTLISALDDPYSRFVDPTDFAPLLKYDISGVGVNVAEDAEDPTKIRVLGLVLDSSAARAGIERGDEIVAVDGESVRGKSAFQARHTGPHTTAFAL